jgi:regulator of protease activity HflC (stomatin/prohibitin superfamily)
MHEANAMNPTTTHRERVVTATKGAPMVVLTLLILGSGAACLVYAALNQLPLFAVAGVVLIALTGLLVKGFFTLQPNEARVMVLFGSYKGTVRKDGFFWANPFYSNGSGQSALVLAAQLKSGTLSDPRSPRRNKISLRARTLNGQILKVNDLRGNPIEIAAVVVWRVADTAQAMFDVDDFEKFVATQSESALRHLANLYAYDDANPEDTTLRRNVDAVSAALCKELEERLARAGVAVDEARLTHLAYASEIAQVMLRSQQADAVINARQKIVQGAVSMVDMALTELAAKHVVELDDERRAAMVSNLMVVLCAESEVHPVVNTGTLYN